MKVVRLTPNRLLLFIVACLLALSLIVIAPSSSPFTPLYAAEAGSGDLVAQGDAAFARENYKEARRLYEEASRAGGQDVHLLSRLALLQSWDGDLRESVENYRRAVKMARTTSISVSSSRES